MRPLVFPRMRGALSRLIRCLGLRPDPNIAGRIRPVSTPWSDGTSRRHRLPPVLRSTFRSRPRALSGAPSRPPPRCRSRCSSRCSSRCGFRCSSRCSSRCRSRPPLTREAASGTRKRPRGSPNRPPAGGSPRRRSARSAPAGTDYGPRTPRAVTTLDHVGSRTAPARTDSPPLRTSTRTPLHPKPAPGTRTRTRNPRPHHADPARRPAAHPVARSPITIRAINSRRLVTPALLNTAFRWSWTVYGVIARARAISLVSQPRTASSATSCSRPVNP